MRWVRGWCLCLCLCLAWPVLAHAQQPVTPVDGSVLVLGRISDNPQLHYEQLKPLLDYVVPRMASVGIRSGRILMAKDLQQMSSYLRRGRVDWISETAGNAAVLERRGVAHAFLLAERDGVARYHSVFFVRRESPILQLADIVGHSVAFQSPRSTSAYYLPAAELLAQGVPLELLLSPMDKPAPDRAGYVFARTELNITTWVHKGLVDVGVVSNLDWWNSGKLPPAFRQDLRIIGSTAEVPRALMLARSGLSAAVEARLREILQQAAHDPLAGEALQRYMGTARFQPITDDERRSLQKLAEGVSRVHAELE